MPISSQKELKNKHMTFKKTLTTIAASATLLGAIATTAYADTSRCQVIYGGGEICDEKIQFSLDKQVKSPSKGGVFVDNLQANDPRFQAGSNIDYKIIVTNTGDKKLSNVTITDTLPQYVTYVSGGSYDNNSKKVTFTIKDLGKGDKQEVALTVKVDGNTLPADQSVVCVVNQASAREDNGATAADSAQACIEKQVLGAGPVTQVITSAPVKKIPETGPEMASLLLLIPSGIGGYLLKKKSSL